MADNHFKISKGLTLAPQASAPSNPGDGDQYFDSSLGKFQFYQGGAFKSLGSGSSGAGKSFFSDFDSELIAKVLTYNDSAAIPVDLTGGTVTGLTTALETTTPLTGTKSYKFSKDAANRQGQGFAILTDETLDYTVKQGESVTVKFKYKTSANYVSGDIKMYVYRVGSNTLEALNGVDGLGAFGNSLNADQTGRGEFTATISCSSSDTAIRVGFHVASTSALAYDLTVDNVFVGTSTVLTAPNLFSGNAYLSANQTGVNPNGSYVKINVNTALHDTNGMFVSGSNRFVFTQNCFSKVSGQISLLSTNVLASGYGAVLYKNGAVVAWGDHQIPPVGTSLYLEVEFEGNFVVGDYVELYLYGAGNNSVSTLTAQGGSSQSRLQIQGWSSGNTISSTQANFQNVFASYAKPSSQSIASGSTTAIIDFSTLIDDDFSTTSTGASWKFTAPVTGRYEISAQVEWAASATGYRLIRLYKNNTGDKVLNYNATPPSGIWMASCAPYTIELNKGDYIDLRAEQNSGGALNVGANGTTYTWITIKKLPDLTVVGISSAPYERISALITAVTATTAADTRTDVTGGSIVVPPGKWKIGYKVATRIQRIGSLGDSYGRVNIESPAGAVMEQTVSFVGNSNMASSESVYDTVSAYQIVDVTTTGTYKLQITSYHAAASGVMHVIANTYGFFSGADADSEIYAERIK